MGLMHEGSPRSINERDLSGTKIEQALGIESYKVLAVPTSKPSTFIFDLDGTLYQNSAYREDVAKQEMHAIATALNWPEEETPTRVNAHRETLGKELGRPARLTETVTSLGLSVQWWNEARNTIYRPEQFINPDSRVNAAFTIALKDGKNVVVATNSPSDVANRMLNLLGVDPSIKGKVYIFGPDKLGVSKPNPEYFHRIAQAVGVPTEECISIGDDEQNDAYPAIDAGMGAVIVSRVDHIGPFINRNLKKDEYQPFDIGKFTRSQFKPGDISIVRLTGRAGAGKTTTGEKLVEMYKQMEISAKVLGLDAFFKLSSAGRKTWLEEGKRLGPEEYAYRADQTQWWDFDRAAETLDTLRAGKPVRLQGIYNRADKGELTGELKINPDPKGTVIIFEGVAVAHLPKKRDHIMYVNAHPKIRRERLLGRDQHRAADAALERFQLTQAFENNYFPQYMQDVDTAVDNSNGFLMKIPTVPQL